VAKPKAAQEEVDALREFIAAIVDAATVEMPDTGENVEAWREYDSTTRRRLLVIRQAAAGASHGLDTLPNYLKDLQTAAAEPLGYKTMDPVSKPVMP
jgi:hypothetical protein